MIGIAADSLQQPVSTPTSKQIAQSACTTGGNPMGCLHPCPHRVCEHERRHWHFFFFFLNKGANTESDYHSVKQLVGPTGTYIAAANTRWIHRFVYFWTLMDSQCMDASLEPVTLSHWLSYINTSTVKRRQQPESTKDGCQQPAITPIIGMLLTVLETDQLRACWILSQLSLELRSLWTIHRRLWIITAIYSKRIGLWTTETHRLINCKVAHMSSCFTPGYSQMRINDINRSQLICAQRCIMDEVHWIRDAQSNFEIQLWSWGQIDSAQRRPDCSRRMIMTGPLNRLKAWSTKETIQNQFKRNWLQSWDTLNHKGYDHVGRRHVSNETIYKQIHSKKDWW